MSKKNIITFGILFISIIVGGIAANDFLQMHQDDVLKPAAGLTKTGYLSDYFEGIKGTSNDSKIYFFDSGNPGATVLLLGGTHPNEPAAFITATVILENIRVKQGRVIILPQACKSGFTCTDPFEGCPQQFKIKTKDGARKFRFGSRVANPLDQWPDPLVYAHQPSGSRYSGFESRNLNRSYPGRPDGTFTEKLAYTIIQLIKSEKVDLAFDLHEAAPEIPIINAIVYHEKSEMIALNAVLSLEMEDLQYKPELSPQNFRGLSHREWGDNTDVFPFLMETSNPIQGRLRGRTNEALIINGLSPRYKEALESEALNIEYLPTGEPLKRRVGRHIMGFRAIIEGFNEENEDRQVIVENLPDYSNLMENDVGAYLN